MKKICLTSLAILLLVAGKAFGQILDLDLQLQDLQKCAITDTVAYRDGNIEVSYYDLNERGERVKRGHRQFNGDTLFAFAWIAEDGIFSVAGMLFENGKLHHVTVGMEGYYKQVISYYDSGHVYGIFNFDENDLDHGWQFWFDETGHAKEKVLFEHGKKISDDFRK